MSAVHASSRKEVEMLDKYGQAIDALVGIVSMDAVKISVVGQQCPFQE